MTTLFIYYVEYQMQVRVRSSPERPEPNMAIKKGWSLEMQENRKNIRKK